MRVSKGCFWIDAHALQDQVRQTFLVQNNNNFVIYDGNINTDQQLLLLPMVPLRLLRVKCKVVGQAIGPNMNGICYST